MSYSIFSIQGRRPYQEDQTSVGEFTNFGNTVNFFAVFDGHGGGACSLWLSKHLLPLFQSNFSTQKLTRRNIKNFFFNIDNSLRKNNIGTSGSTAIICLMCFDKNILINLGDSRALCFYKDPSNKQINNTTSEMSLRYKDSTLHPRILQATLDHSVINDAQRIAASGAFVMSNNKYLVNPDKYTQLGVARAFGDFDFKQTNPPYVGNEPDIYKIPLLYEPYQIVLASDGLWDIFSNVRLIEFIDKEITPRKVPNIAEWLVKTAYKSGSQDNITAIVLTIY